MLKYKKLIEHQVDWTGKESPPPHNIETLNIQNKERLLKAAREKGQVTYKDLNIRIIPDFSIQTLKTRRA